jgi:hypothetical protein
MGGVQRFAFFKTSKRLDRALIILLAISVVFGFYGLATGDGPPIRAEYDRNFATPMRGQQCGAQHSRW